VREGEGRGAGRRGPGRTAAVLSARRGGCGGGCGGGGAPTAGAIRICSSALGSG